MDKNIAIEFDGVGKQYRLGLVGTGSLQHDLNRWWQTAVLHKEDPYLKIGEVNDRSKKGTSDYVWALKDISFKVEQGDVVGIIGKNGAGKSTLLKLLSHITAPSVGHISYRGRIASLLEVGTGFHPEMTARQNIYMNGSIMGMTRHEITSKLDEIVDFAGIERYLDTPVKRFSSGMTVRLGFAVAAFLEPEILVVDEVLAVGDAEFQKKAIGKMNSVAKDGGRTVLFVSHNMAAVRSLCHNGIVLKNGTLAFCGSVNDSIEYYLRDSDTQFDNMNLSEIPRPTKNLPQSIVLTKLELLDDNDHPIVIRCGRYVKFRIHFYVKESLNAVGFSLGIRDLYENPLLSFPTRLTSFPQNYEVGKYYVDLEIEKFPLTEGRYKLRLSSDFRNQLEDYIENISLNVENDDYFGMGFEIPKDQIGRAVLYPHKWSLKK